MDEYYAGGAMALFAAAIFSSSRYQEVIGAVILLGAAIVIALWRRR